MPPCLAPKQCSLKERLAHSFTSCHGSQTISKQGLPKDPLPVSPLPLFSSLGTKCLPLSFLIHGIWVKREGGVPLPIGSLETACARHTFIVFTFRTMVSSLKPVAHASVVHFLLSLPSQVSPSLRPLHSPSASQVLGFKGSFHSSQPFLFELKSSQNHILFRTSSRCT